MHTNVRVRIDKPWFSDSVKTPRVALACGIRAVAHALLRFVPTESVAAMCHEGLQSGRHSIPA
jgi:hypothetical protein